MAELDADERRHSGAPVRSWPITLARARRPRCLSQAEIAERLARFTGAKWTQATVSQADGSVLGHRVRQ